MWIISNLPKYITSTQMPTSRYVYVADSQTEGAGEGLWVKTDIRVGFHLRHHFHLLLASDPLYIFCNVLCSKVILSGGSDRCGLQRAETEGPARGQVWRQDLVRLQDQVSLMNLKRGSILDSSLSSCSKEIDLDIGKEEESLSNYRATLAHKCCHSFKPNAHFAQFWHPM